MNFLIAGYAYTDGDVAFDPSVPLTDAKLRTNSAVFAYARAIDLFGHSAKFDVVLPYASLSGNAKYDGQPRERDVTGMADPRFRLSVGLMGSPALQPREFAQWRQDLIVGASLQVSAPWGEYDPSRLVNIGTNRWAFKPELGVSKAFGSWIVELAPSVTIFTANNDFLNGGKLTQDPIYAVQLHVIHTFRSGVWAAFDATWYAGGRTTTNGLESDTLQRNTRAGALLAIPIDRRNSLKLYASTGATSRTGTSFDAVGVAWQYRWGGGL